MKLNELQTRVLDRFLNSNKNLLIVSPTGSGKTFIAELIASQVPYRVLYTEPLKAMVYQVVEDFKRKFNGFSSVLPLLSEAYEDDPDNIQEKVVVSTYEKADSVTRRPYKFLEYTKLLIIDEIHNVNDKERGKAIENLVVWAKDEGVRIMAMSATVPFIDEIASWLNAEVIKSDVRPIPLYKYVKLGHTLYGADDNINVKGDLITKLVKAGKVVMIFTSTKKKAEALYYLYEKKFGDKVTYIHAGLDPETRKKVIEDTYAGKYNIVIATTVLGQGVNLPFHTVIFDDVRLPIIEQGRFSGWRELTSMEFDQICGRAGRPGFDEEGMCIVEAENEYELRKFMKKYIKGDPVPLSPNHNIYDLLIAVLTRLLWAEEDRLYRNVTYSLSFRDVSYRTFKDALEEMRKFEIVGWDGRGWYITRYGQAVGYSYLDIESAGHYIQGLKQNKDFKELILTSPKVLEASKGEDPSWIIDAWINGMDEKAILKHTQRMGYSDLSRLVSTVAWQSFGLYRIMNALDMKEESKKVLYYYLQVSNGVPLQALALIQIPGIGRKRAIALLNAGIRSKSDICLKRNTAIQILGETMVRYLCH